MEKDDLEIVLKIVQRLDIKTQIIVGLVLMGYTIPECSSILGHTRGAIALRWRNMIVEVRGCVDD